mgnify:CR=1 FL=1
MNESSLFKWIDQQVDQQPFLDKDALISIFEKRVIELLQEQPDLLFSFLYRLDVDELKIKKALKTKNAPRALATLIVDRQLARLKTKSQHKKNNSLSWE